MWSLSNCDSPEWKEKFGLVVRFRHAQHTVPDFLLVGGGLKADEAGGKSSAIAATSNRPSGGQWPETESRSARKAAPAWETPAPAARCAPPSGR